MPDRRLAGLLDALGGDRDGIRTVRAPGRVNLIGDHTDYCEGFVLPLAIDRDCLVAARARTDGRVTARSSDLPGLVDLRADGTDDPASVEPRWGGFVAGTVRALAARGIAVSGLDVAIASTVPAGSGLSSSAALAVALTLAATTVAGAALDPKELATVARDAETAATGVETGLMDQLASVFGVDGHALLIDCRSLAIEPIPLPSALGVLVVHSGLPRALADSEYAQRRAACAAAAARLGIASLRDAHLDQMVDDPLARHVVTENRRVQAAADALRSGDVGALGPLMRESHASLRDDYRVSTPELDALVKLLVDAGALGARLTGAGFGGCVVALVQRNHADDVAARATLAYQRETGLTAEAFAVRAVAGAGPVSPTSA
jgi:galactokinase